MSSIDQSLRACWRFGDKAAGDGTAVPLKTDCPTEDNGLGGQVASVRGSIQDTFLPLVRLIIGSSSAGG